MSEKTNLTNLELQVTQKIQLHFPRGTVSQNVLMFWDNCQSDLLRRKLQEFFGEIPKEEFLTHVADYTLPIWNETKNLIACRKKFESFFDENLVNWGLDIPQSIGGELGVSIKKMELGKNGTYGTIYDSLNRPLESMCIDQNRIVQILFSDDDVSKKIREDLDLENFWPHFLVKKVNPKNGEASFFVAYVHLPSDGINVHVNKLGIDIEWRGSPELRFVVSG